MQKLRIGLFTGAGLTLLAAVALPLSVYQFAPEAIASLVPHTLLLNTFLFTGLLAGIAVALALQAAVVLDGKTMTHEQLTDRAVVSDSEDAGYQLGAKLHKRMLGLNTSRTWRKTGLVIAVFSLLGLAGDIAFATINHMASNVEVFAQWFGQLVHTQYTQHPAALAATAAVALFAVIAVGVRIAYAHKNVQKVDRTEELVAAVEAGVEARNDHEFTVTMSGGSEEQVMLANAQEIAAGKVIMLISARSVNTVRSLLTGGIPVIAAAEARAEARAEPDEAAAQPPRAPERVAEDAAPPRRAPNQLLSADEGTADDDALFDGDRNDDDKSTGTLRN